MADIDVVMDKLHNFESADDLAEYFEDYGIIARPRHTRSCAIAQFVSIETGRPIVVAGHALRIEDENGALIEYIRHTEAMAQFVQNYDYGRYPNLIEKGYEVHDSIDV
jgi:hypothetical protein